MTFLNSWEDFEMAAERLYLQDPMKVSTEQSGSKGENDNRQKTKIRLKLVLFCNLF